MEDGARDTQSRGLPGLGSASAEAEVAALRGRLDSCDPHAGPASRPRAEGCRRLAELLLALGRGPEAAQALQEATDTFSRIVDGEEDARECARRLLDVVRGLWGHPESRLYLLVAQHDRELRRLAAAPGTETERARIEFRIATILQRRDRFAEAADRYEKARGLFAASAATGLDTAVCHQRLAGLYHHELGDPAMAATHYKAAIALFRRHEPVSEGTQMNRVLCEQLLAAVRSLGRRPKRPQYQRNAP